MNTKSALCFLISTLVLALVVVACYWFHKPHNERSSFHTAAEKSVADSKWVLADCESNKFELNFLLSSLGLLTIDDSIESLVDLASLRSLLGLKCAESGSEITVASLLKL